MRFILKALLMFRYFWKFPRIQGAWPKYEYIKPWLTNLNPDLIIDVGVNNGQFLHLAYRLFPEARILGIEPLASLGTKISGIYKNDERVEIIFCACGETNGKTNFYIFNDSQNSSTHEPTSEFYEERTNNKIIECVNIDLKRLDSIIEECESILLKVDVQGSELEVLKGLGEKINSVYVCIIEAPFEKAYKNAANFDDIYSFFKENGFCYRGSFGQLESKSTGYVRQEDSIYINSKYL